MKDFTEKYKQAILGAIVMLLVSYTGFVATGAINWLKYPFTNAVTDSLQGIEIKKNSFEIKKCATKKDVYQADSVILYLVRDLKFDFEEFEDTKDIEDKKLLEDMSIIKSNLEYVKLVLKLEFLKKGENDISLQNKVDSLILN